MAHENDPDIDEPYVPPAGNVLGESADTQTSTEQPARGDPAEGQTAFQTQLVDWLSPLCLRSKCIQCILRISWNMSNYEELLC